MPGADPGFLRHGRVPTPEMGQKSIIGKNFCRKLHENEGGGEMNANQRQSRIFNYSHFLDRYFPVSDDSVTD